jgi:hypothetical protein
MVKALNQVHAYESIMTTLTTVGKELTIENLQDAFASRHVPTIPGAFMANGSSHQILLLHNYLRCSTCRNQWHV